MWKVFDKKKTIQNVKIANWSHTYNGNVGTQNVDILNSSNPVLQLKNTEFPLKRKFKDLLSEKVWIFDDHGFRVLKIESYNATKYNNLCSTLKAERIINENVIDNAFKSISSTTILNIQKSFGKGRVGLLIESSITLLISENSTIFRSINWS